MIFGLPDDVAGRIREVFARHPEIDRVILYGSRAKGSFREGSDIDLTLEGAGMTLSLLLTVENELDDLLLPYCIDLSLREHIEAPEVRGHIARVGQVFYPAQ